MVFCLVAGAVGTDRIAGEDRFQVSSVTSSPVTLENEEKTRFQIDVTRIDTRVWQEAIRKALKHSSGRGHYTILRLVVEDALPTEQIQAQATKLKELTETYDGGGGAFQVVTSGQFLFFQHINTNARRNNRDRVFVGSFSHGQSELWVDVPPPGVLGVAGDVVLKRCPEEDLGTLQVKVNALRGTKFCLGPVMVGGPYGTTHRLNAEGEFELLLAPGKYKFLMPEFDVVKSRWDVTIQSGKTTLLEFDENEHIDADAEAVKPSNRNEP